MVGITRSKVINPTFFSDPETILYRPCLLPLADFLLPLQTANRLTPKPFIGTPGPKGRCQRQQGQNERYGGGNG